MILKPNYHVLATILFFALNQIPVEVHACEQALSCNPQVNLGLLSKNSFDRTRAIHKCLTVLSKKFPPGTMLYTYGHPEKIQTLQTYGQEDRWAYQRAFRLTREIRMILDIPIKHRTEVLYLANQLAIDNYDLNDLVKTYRIHRIKNNEQPLSETEATAFQFAAFSKIYPNLLKQLSDPDLQQSLHEDESPDSKAHFKLKSSISLSKIIAFKNFLTPEKVLKRSKSANAIDEFEPRSSVERAESEGMQHSELTSPGFDSTAGEGIYLSENPIQSIDHTGEGDGLACTAPRGKVLINFDDSCVKENLINANIYIPERLENREDQFILRPHGKNLFVSPTDFEKAAKGYIIAFRPSKLRPPEPPYYVEKKAIQFGIHMKKCRLISIRDFAKCDHFKKLLSLPNIPKAIESRDHFQQQFNSILHNCPVHMEAVP